jgi:hypothetical protein
MKAYSNGSEIWLVNMFPENHPLLLKNPVIELRKWRGLSIATNVKITTNPN